jgi:hypothetical protein
MNDAVEFILKLFVALFVVAMNAGDDFEAMDVEDEEVDW